MTPGDLIRTKHIVSTSRNNAVSIDFKADRGKQMVFMFMGVIESSKELTPEDVTGRLLQFGLAPVVMMSEPEVEVKEEVNVEGSQTKVG